MAIEQKIVFERNGDAWQSRGSHAREVAKALGTVVVQSNGGDVVFFWDHNKEQYATDLRAAGYKPIFADRR